MEKYIFKKFTIENKVIVSKEALDFMKINIKDINDINDIIVLYKTETQIDSIDMTILKKIIKKFYTTETTQNFYLKGWEYLKTTREDRYNFLKDKIKYNVDLVHELEENKSSKVFGICYKNKNNKFVLEDESGYIELQFGDVNCFVIDFVFLILKGIKTGGVFVVDGVKYVPVEKEKKINLKESEEFKKDILFFYGKFNQNINCNEKEVFLIHPETIQIRDLAISKGVKVLEKDEYSLTNPSFLFVNGKTILLYCSELFKNKENGEFIGKGYVNSFIKTYTTQYDLSPFSPPHVYINSIPDVFIIFQDSYSFIEVSDCVTFVSVSPFKETGIYLEYIIEADMFVLRTKKD